MCVCVCVCVCTYVCVCVCGEWVGVWFDFKDSVLSRNTSGIILGVVYLPPEGSPYFTSDTFNATKRH